MSSDRLKRRVNRLIYNNLWTETNQQAVSATQQKISRAIDEEWPGNRDTVHAYLKQCALCGSSFSGSHGSQKYCQTHQLMPPAKRRHLMRLLREEGHGA